MFRNSQATQKNTHLALLNKLKDILEKAGLSRDATLADIAAKVCNNDGKPITSFLNSAQLTGREMVEDYGKQAKAPQAEIPYTGTLKDWINYWRQCDPYFGSRFTQVKYTSDVVYLDGGIVLDRKQELHEMICDEASVNRQSKKTLVTKI